MAYAGPGVIWRIYRTAILAQYYVQVEAGLTFITFMQVETAERWRTLCEKVATEQDHEKLLELTKELNRLLDEKEQRLKQQQSTDSPDTAA